MAIHYGFFDSVNSDRKYSAEDFNRYLSGLISDGIFESYGECFYPSVNGNILSIAPGKAWIKGHFFESDTTITYDLSNHIKANSETQLYVQICCNTSARTCSIIYNENYRLYDSNDKYYIPLAEIIVKPSTSTILHQVIDLRGIVDNSGYVKCVLTKCGISDFLKKLDNYNAAINRVNQRLTEIENITGTSTVTIVKQGNCGANVKYTVTSDGVARLSGSGYTNDYSALESPFSGDMSITHIIIGAGIKSIGDYLFYDVPNIEILDVQTDTLSKIGKNAFAVPISHIGMGVKSIKLPQRLTIFGTQAFAYTGVESIYVPPEITTVTTYNGETTMGQFRDCRSLEDVTIGCKRISDYMFLNCVSLKEVAISSACTEIGANAFKGCSTLDTIVIPFTCKKIGSSVFAGCSNLTSIRYNGTVAQWRTLVTRGTGWCDDTLTEIYCTDKKLVRQGAVFIEDTTS